MHQRIVLIGAGSAQFGFGTLSDIFASKVLEGSEIVLHDINPQALKRTRDAAQAHVEAHALPFTLTATADRKAALQGANFAIISIEVGNRFELWEQDWMIPLQYGIRQVYGENGGPGGLFHSLRIIPPILDICDDIMAICPEAYVFNFSNPMSRICLTAKRKHPDLRLVGLCHEFASLPQHLPKILDTPWENLFVRAGGLNHFSVVLEARYKDTGRDAYPDIRAKAPAYFEQLPGRRERVEEMQREQAGSTPGAEPALRKSANPWPERWLFKVILEKFGYLPITTDSHFGEYIQWAHDVVDHKGILDFYYYYKQWCQMNEARLGPTSEWERVIPIIEGILTDSGQEEMAVNIMNDGLITNLAHDLAVEVPATVDKNGVHGIVLGDLPKGIVGLLNNQVATYDLTAEAILKQSKALALQALLLDPVVHSARAAEQTLEMMLIRQEQYLGYLK
ncbi:MAG TPA: alpha-glucosidase [Anaerolineae bacterium]|nr:MAG: Alpha-glucosidase [Chloroflexi bacterium ADurb.Bin222]HOC21693.1 alpha-glucosidase [Anaerolineae bacterium]HOS78725.1 alpha-glucosidase [Anaerolineae bacterium]HQE98118.1 alpha-glucosidase [Anaerolineae bacterium]HQJ10372.1 alpha-glucosidase [Anaerolineae bacterium]